MRRDGEAVSPRAVLESRKGSPFVYFIASGDLVKIGFTRSIAARLKKMFTDVPDPSILWIEAGDLRQEKILHRHFKAIRVRGEWFKKTPELMAHLRDRHRLKRPDDPLPPELAE